MLYNVHFKGNKGFGVFHLEKKVSTGTWKNLSQNRINAALHLKFISKSRAKTDSHCKLSLNYITEVSVCQGLLITHLCDTRKILAA